MKIISLIGSWLKDVLGIGIGKDIINGLAQAHRDRLDAENDSQRIAADKAVSFWEHQFEMYKEGTNRQRLKMNHKVFWFIICAVMLPGLGTYLLLSVYNVLWWEHGIWPQTWKIAGFPAPYDRYLEYSMDWIFDPVKLATNTTIATVAGYAAGFRK